MKVYFFSNQNWGPCYTVLAKDKKEATAIVKKHILDEEKRVRSKEPYVETPIKKVGEVDLRSYGSEMHKFDIVEFVDGEVIDTEYS